jgi:chromosomal replication initiation ATPase DnaA
MQLYSDLLQIVVMKMFLDFEWDQSFAEDLFIVDQSNLAACKWINSPDRWPGNHAILHGPSNSGKSHLAWIWAKKYNATTLVRPNYNLDLRSKYLVIDSIEEIADEEFFMYIFYLSSSLDLVVLWLSAKHPKELNTKLNDLHTRFVSMMSLKIEEPTEKMFKEILQKRAADFGLQLNHETLEYIARRSEITYKAINDIVLRLHYQCLKLNKPPTTAILQDILCDL